MKYFLLFYGKKEKIMIFYESSPFFDSLKKKVVYGHTTHQSVFIEGNVYITLNAGFGNRFFIYVLDQIQFK